MFPTLFMTPDMDGISERQYKSILNKWNVGKNIRKDEMKAIVRKRQSRLVREPDKRANVFELRGEIVPEEKITRFMRREEIPVDLVYSPASGARKSSGIMVSVEPVLTDRVQPLLQRTYSTVGHPSPRMTLLRHQYPLRPWTDINS